MEEPQKGQTNVFGFRSDIATAAHIVLRSYLSEFWKTGVPPKAPVSCDDI